MESAHASAWVGIEVRGRVLSGRRHVCLPFGAHLVSVTLGLFLHRQPKYDFAFSFFLLIEKQNIQLENKRLRKKEECFSLAFQSGVRSLCFYKRLLMHIQLGLIWKYQGVPQLNKSKTRN